MKLKYDFLTQEIEGTRFLVPVGEGAFSGLLRSNDTAAFIVEQLRQETTPEAIAEALCREYEAPRETVAEDVARFLDVLRQIGALAE